jgi:pimeloyl-ACP methyl ester carboxylesterase
MDERGAGRTLRKNGPAIAPTITVDRMVQDGIELSEYLRKHLGKDKIIIVAHSFGSILGLGMVGTRSRSVLRIRGHRTGCRRNQKLLCGLRRTTEESASRS